MMNTLMKTLMVLAMVAMMVPGTATAQKKKTQQRKKKATTQQMVTYPQRDQDFVSDYKLEPIGDFELYTYDHPYVTLPAPDFKGHVLKRDMKRKQITLKQVSCKENDITDTEEWFERNGLKKTEYRYNDEPMPEMRPRYRYDTGGYSVVLYGTTWGDTYQLVVADKDLKKMYKAYDFENFKRMPGVTNHWWFGVVHYVMIEGNVMYVMHTSSGSKEAVNNQTGYISAIDMRTDEIIWTTQPVTADSGFEITGNSIVCGFGGSGEVDYLYVVDKYSGQRVQKIWLRKAMDYAVAKDRKMYVRTYSYDYVFSY